jgi:hypothetical protein
MTVKELILKLSGMPDGALVVTYDELGKLDECETVGLVSATSELSSRKLQRELRQGKVLVWVT